MRFTYNIVVFFLVISACSCAVMRKPSYSKKRPISTSNIRNSIVIDAQSFIGGKKLRSGKKSFNFDCSGLILAVYHKNGIDILGKSNSSRKNLVKSIYDSFSSNGIIYTKRLPLPGDIVFFSNTYKKFGTNTLSHAGIVEKVENDGTVIFIHRSSKGIKRGLLNLNHPHTYKSNSGKKLNSFLRRRNRYDPPGVKYLAAELFEAYGSLIQ